MKEGVMARGYFKEDSTRGKNPLVRPKTYKGDSFVQVWLDRRKVALISIWLDKNEMKTRFMSDVVRMALDQLYNHLVNSGEMQELDTVTAGNILEMKYKVDLNPSGRGQRNLIHNMVLSEKIEEQKIADKKRLMSSMEDSETCVQNQDDDEIEPAIGTPERLAWISRRTAAVWKGKGIEVAPRVSEEDAKKSALELYPDLVLYVPTDKEVAEQKERKRLAEIEAERRRAEIRAKEEEDKLAEKLAAKEAREKEKIKSKMDALQAKLDAKSKKDDDTPRKWEDSDEEEWNRKEAEKTAKITGDWGSPDPSKMIK